jgi:beta-xylosidase
MGLIALTFGPVFTRVSPAWSPDPSPSTGGDASGAPSPEPDNTLRVRDFPDPFLLTTASGPVAYATNAGGKNVQVGYIANGDGAVSEALPEVARWSEPGYVWAPAVAEMAGRYVLYYTTRDRTSGRQCISVATSSAPTGPFVDATTEPLVCDPNRGDSIDASPVQDGTGQWSLVWKGDGDCCESRAVIYSQRLDASGQHLVGDPVALVGTDQGWEGPWIEAPSLIEFAGTWYLFYSGNGWDSAAYAIGYAVCDSPQGPCTKPTNEPLLSSNAHWSGPGGAEALVGRGGRPALIFAAWTPGRVGYENGGQRRVHLQRIVVNGSVVAVSNAS